MRSRDLRVRGPWAALIQCSAFVRKELAEIVRQPRLILLLILGPFALLMLFGLGYRSESLGLRTMFVGPPFGAVETAHHARPATRVRPRWTCGRRLMSSVD